MPHERARDRKGLAIRERVSPVLIRAGTYNAGVNRTFWDVHNPDHAILIKLKSSQDLFGGIEDRYDELIVEVGDPAETVERINRALPKA